MFIFVRFNKQCKKPAGCKMRSKSNGVESPTDGVLVVSPGGPDINEEQDVGLPVRSLKAKAQQKEGAEEVEVISDKEKLLLDSTKTGNNTGNITDLSKQDLLKLLGIMEGEVQVGKNCLLLVCFSYRIFELE
ncbi:hypothetical protein XENOCAPTIV_004526 [Xenoophorus captivus]|uniref:Uncharacterized protein n=1 Tax=Xenoophorus captivus TaxID=1517983 RepID=A0ABV0S7F2_9TELE